MEQEFAKLLAERLKKIELGQSDLAAALAGRGIPTSRQVVHRWCAGETRPEPWKWGVLLDTLLVPAAERKGWEEALAARPPVRSEVA